MSQLTIYAEDGSRELTIQEHGEQEHGQQEHAEQKHAEMAQQLSQVGVLFERWNASRMLADDAEQTDILSAYDNDIQRLNRIYGFQSVDVINITPDTPNISDIRNKFLQEHTHDDFEMRFFVRGKGLFYIRTNNKIFAVLCTQGDLISVPADTPHWFDTGAKPTLTAIRLFANPDGWIPNFTGDNIAQRFPLLAPH